MEIEICPSCNSTDQLREILYGMPEGPLDESKFETGGCCISEKDPTVICKNCGWEGYFINNIESLG